MNNKLLLLPSSKMSPMIGLCCIILFSCHENISSGKASSGESKDGTKEKAEMKTVTPVTVTSPAISRMQEEVELNATSDFLAKNIVKATTNGYLGAIDIHLGQQVRKGQVLLTLKGKETENLGNSLHELGDSFHFTGSLKVLANSNGFITAIGHQQGDYVQEGDLLAEISDAASLVFLLQLPYELTPFLSGNKQLTLTLPDGKQLKGSLDSSMPIVDAASQTQSIIIRTANDGTIPQNLIAKVKLVKKAKAAAISLSKSAVLTDETQQHFWIMKMINQDTAIKVPVEKGLEADGRIEILSPALSAADRILDTGNYGLSDTAKVTIQHP